FAYQMQKLGEARRFLMAFYLKEGARFGNADACCQLALRDFDSAQVKDKAMRAKIEELKSLMEVATGLMTYDQKVVFATIVDEVADWFVKEHCLSRGPEPIKPAAKPKVVPPVRKAKAARPKPIQIPKKHVVRRGK